MSFTDFFRRRLSWHYLEGIGDSMWSVVGGKFDEALQAGKDGLKARMPALCPDDGLPELGRTFNLDYPSRITPAAARIYMGDPWTHWSNAGTRARMQAEIAALGYAQNAVVTYRDLVDTLGKPPTVFGGFSSFWYLVIGPPHPWTGAYRYGDPPPGPGDGRHWGEGGQVTWGSSARWSEIEEIRRAIRKWKAAGSSCRFIEVWLKVDMFGIPTSIVRWPVHEYWEQLPDGSYLDFYNTGY